MTMQKNCVYGGEVCALGTEGEGIIKSEGTTAFVPFCLVGEKVRFKVLKVKGNISYGKVEEILSASPDRIEPPCPVFKKCGGCDIQHMNYSAQLAFKRGLVEGALKKLGGIYAAVNEVVPCENQFRYRNKLALPIGVQDGKTVLGFYASHSHRIVPVSDCLIQSEWVKKIIECVQKYATVSGFSGYDELSGKGELRHIVVREIKGKFIIALVATRKIDTRCLEKELEKYFENFTLLLNINSSDTNVIFSKEWHICRGEGFFEAEEGGIKYTAGANTFLQVNDSVRTELYARVLAEAKSEGAVAIDLYSGGGMLTAMLAKACGVAFGVEIVEEASRCADELRDKNGLQGAMFNICGKVEDKLDEVFAATEGKKRVIVCDPPRKGMERSVVKKIAESSADKIILVSCNPATLARDLGLLTGTLIEDSSGALVKADNPAAAYAIKSITPFDMFPQTKHVETLVLLSHKKPDSCINIKFEFGEGENKISAEKLLKKSKHINRSKKSLIK